jgi:hypothetical protein
MRARDFQLRRALQGTPVWGAWMTDIVKDCPMLRASDVVRDINQGRIDAAEHVGRFEVELSELGANSPVLIAFGKSTDKILRDHLAVDKYRIFRVTHYSAPVRSGKLRQEIMNVVAQTQENRSDIMTPVSR